MHRRAVLPCTVPKRLLESHDPCILFDVIGLASAIVFHVLDSMGNL